MTSLSVADWTRASVFLGSDPEPKTEKRRAYPFHGFILDCLDPLCEEARDRKEGDHNYEPDKCTPTEDGV